MQERFSLQSTAEVFGIPATTVRDALQRKELKCITITLFPTLSEENKLARLRFAHNLEDSSLAFCDMYSYVYWNEKWFFWTKSWIKCIQWDFVEQVAAEHDSKNKPTWTLELKPKSITKTVSRDYVTQPHLRKAHCQRSGEDIKTVVCDAHIYNDINTYLQDHFHGNVMSISWDQS